MAFDLSEYRTVAERIADFKAKHPDGCLRPADLENPYRIECIGGSYFIVYCAAAYRSPDDPTPGIGVAWEPFPGKTNYTRDSELQNAETSAWGRALIAVLATESKNIASQEDVRNRRADQDDPLEDPAVPGLRSSIEGAIKTLTDEQQADLKAWFAENEIPPVRRCNAAQCDVIIGHLISLPKIDGDPVPPSPAGVAGAGSPSSDPDGGADTGLEVTAASPSEDDGYNMALASEQTD